MDISDHSEYSPRSTGRRLTSLRLPGSFPGFFGGSLFLDDSVFGVSDGSQPGELFGPTSGSTTLLVGGLVLGGSDLVFFRLLLVGLHVYKGELP